jgi:hypothetical protein
MDLMVFLLCVSAVHAMVAWIVAVGSLVESRRQLAEAKKWRDDAKRSSEHAVATYRAAAELFERSRSAQS